MNMFMFQYSKNISKTTMMTLYCEDAILIDC